MGVMKIAITGGSGFIGGALAALLKTQGHELVLIDLHKSVRYPGESVIADIRDADTLSRALAGVDVIYHLAAEHRDDVRPVQKYYDVNVGGAQNIIAAAEQHGIKTIIFTSSVAVYGLDAGDSRETDTPAPFNDYGASKLQSEKIFADWAAKDKTRTLVTTRLVATFGPGNRGNIYTLIEQIARGRFVMVGSGRNRKSIAYVGNVASFLAHCLKCKPGSHLYNYADKPDLSMKDLVRETRAHLRLSGSGPRLPFIAGLAGGMVFDLAARVTGRNFPVSAIRVRKFCANTIVNADKAMAEFTPPYTLQGGLGHMIAAEFPIRKSA